MKAILYNNRTAIGETANNRFAVYKAMIAYPQITSGEVYDTETNWTMTINRKDTPKRYLNPKNWTNTQLHYEIKMY